MNGSDDNTDRRALRDEIKSLENEKRLAIANTTEEAIVAQRQREAMNETQRILFSANEDLVELEKKKEIMQQEYEAKAELLEDEYTLVVEKLAEEFTEYQ